MQCAPQALQRASVSTSTLITAVLSWVAGKLWRSQAISLDGLLDYEEDDREVCSVFPWLFLGAPKATQGQMLPCMLAMRLTCRRLRFSTSAVRHSSCCMSTAGGHGGAVAGGGGAAGGAGHRLRQRDLRPPAGREVSSCPHGHVHWPILSALAESTVFDVCRGLMYNVGLQLPC